ncbi:unnamed protein product [Lactuca saligna]|uniref:Uncharacterized protein n=1 Tax=Lactuca saligna TaxID=75948 RepID=A0AA35YCD4_LACSI|nr:unnamed protein product [Lactuca saligna]
MPLSPHSIFTLTRSQVSAIKDPEHRGDEDAAADDESGLNILPLLTTNQLIPPLPRPLKLDSAAYHHLRNLPQPPQYYTHMVLIILIRIRFEHLPAADDASGQRTFQQLIPPLPRPLKLDSAAYHHLRNLPQPPQIVPETLEPSLQLASAVLAQAKLPMSEIAATINEFRSCHLLELTEIKDNTPTVAPVVSQDVNADSNNKIVPETLEPSLQLASAVLAQAKLPMSEISATINEFRSCHLLELTEIEEVVAEEEATNVKKENAARVDPCCSIG